MAATNSECGGSKAPSSAGRPFHPNGRIMVLMRWLKKESEALSRGRHSVASFDALRSRSPGDRARSWNFTQLVLSDSEPVVTGYRGRCVRDDRATIDVRDLDGMAGACGDEYRSDADDERELTHSPRDDVSTWR